MVQSKILLPYVDNIKETLNDNYFVVIVEGCCFIGTALNIRAILSDSPARDTGEEIGSTLLFFSIGQIIMFIFVKLFHRIIPYDDRAEAKRGNPAAGIKMGANIVALSFLVSSPLKKTEELGTLLVYVIVCSIFLFGFTMLLDKLVLPGKMNDEISRGK